MKTLKMDISKLHISSLRNVIVLAGLASLVMAFSSNNAIAASSRPLPSPAILMYDYSDLGYQTFPSVWEDVFTVATIIEGQTSNVTLINRLRSEGKIFVYTVSNTFPDTATVEDVVTAWAAPFENTLNGQLPGGFDGICIDELHSSGVDGSAESIRVVNALQTLRQRYPNKYIMAAGVWKLGMSGSSFWVQGQSFDNQLLAVRDYCDLFFQENYISESNIQLFFFNDIASNINNRISGLLAKTIYGLGIPQSTPLACDNSPYINFNEYLDCQFHTILNNILAKTMPGVGFWIFYRARPETILHCSELCRHYYYQNKTTYYGSGNYNSTLILDPSFELGSARWRTSTATFFTPYSQVPVTIPSQHYSTASHENSCLKTTRGAIANRIRQIVSVEPGAWHRLSGYVTANTQNFGATIGAFDHRGEAYFTTSKTFNLTFTTVPDKKWNRISIRFKVPTSTTKMVLFFTDKPSAQNTVMYWDFFELEKDYIDQTIPEVTW